MIDNEAYILRDKICNAIKCNIKDIAIINGVDWQEYKRLFGGWCVTRKIAPSCYLDRCKAICSIYYDYCNSYFLPLCPEDIRKQKCLEAINKYFEE